MTNNDERQVIRDAMDRLLAGKPIRSSGALTVVALAEEANVKRHLLTHRHVDLRGEFYARVRSQGLVPQSEVKLREQIAKLEQSVKKLQGANAELKTEVALFARMNNVLAAENSRLVAADEAIGAGPVSPLRPR